jgi:hypothetical protein
MQAVLGKTRSGVVVATSSRSRSLGCRPAASSAARAAAVARSLVSFTLCGDMALADAGALYDPLVIGIDQFLEVRIGQDVCGKITARAENSGIVQAATRWISCI